MSKKKNIKTNALRILDSKKIDYKLVEYIVDENDLSGLHVAEQLGQDPRQIFKTIVLKGDRNGYIVCCIPVSENIDLKKVAKLAGEKKVELIPMKQLLSITGYIRGGCSPIGMKKSFPTFIDRSARNFESIALSAGKRGLQFFSNPEDVARVCRAQFAELI